MRREGTSDKVTPQEFIEGVLSGGKRRGTMLQLAITAGRGTPSTPSGRASTRTADHTYQLN